MFFVGFQSSWAQRASLMVLAIFLNQVFATVCVAQSAGDRFVVYPGDSREKVEAAVCHSLWNHLAGAKGTTVRADSAKFAMVEPRDGRNIVLVVVWNRREKKTESLFLAQMVVPRDSHSRPYVVSEIANPSQALWAVFKERIRVDIDADFQGSTRAERFYEERLTHALNSRAVDFKLCDPLAPRN